MTFRIRAFRWWQGLALVLTACGAASGSTAEPSALEPVGTTKSQSTGIPECDRYLEMVERCLPRMPSEDRAAARFALDRMREILPSLAARGDGAAARQCAENVANELRVDEYGCHADEGRTAGVLSPCDLVTSSELEAILGVRFAEPERDGTTCTFPPAEGSIRFVQIEVAWSDGAEEMEAWRAGAGLTAASLTGATGEEVVLQEGLADLGDDALSTLGMLQVRKGDAFFSLHAFGSSEEGAIAVARKIVSRLP